MPCDTTYTTSVMDLGKLDRAVLARSLAADGWTVIEHDATHLVATRPGRVRLSVTDAGADLRTSNYSARPDELKRSILQGYGRLAATETAKRFGFRKLGETKLEGGAIKLTLTRNALGGAKLGKVGL